MKRGTILTLLLSSALAFGQKFEVSDLSAGDSPVFFSGTAKVSKTGTICVVTLRNKSTQGLLAVEVRGEVTSPQGSNQGMGLSYDHFFKDGGIAPGEDFDVVGPDFFDFDVREYINGVPVKPQPQKDMVCHAEAKVLFVQFEDGSTWGDYQAWKDLMAKRAKHMAILSHLVHAYDTGGGPHLPPLWMSPN